MFIEAHKEAIRKIGRTDSRNFRAKTSLNESIPDQSSKRKVFRDHKSINLTENTLDSIGYMEKGRKLSTIQN